jgi:NADH-quinone oxidoreductase subunit N
MSAPILWIVFPGLAAGVLYLLRRWERLAQVSGILITLILAWIAWQLPLGEIVSLGKIPGLPRETTVFVDTTLTLLGRRFILTNALRPILVMIYLGVAFWFGGAVVARVSRLFVPLGLTIAALLTASLAVEPFLYAALIIEITALISVPILSPPGKHAGRGVLRFLTFQTMGMPFILLAGWALGGVTTHPTDPAVILRVAVFMVLGFTLLMAIFPFHTWIPMLAEEAHPYSAAFVFFILPTIVAMFGLEFLGRYTWLRSSPTVFLVLRFLGILMAAYGGVWAAFQNHLGRILGYTVIYETGLSLLAISLIGDPQDGQMLMGIFFALLAPRAVALALWAEALSVLQARFPELTFENLGGAARQMPVATAGILLAQFSTAGLPLLAGFPVQVALWSSLASRAPAGVFLAVLGNIGLLFAGMRTLAIFITGPQDTAWSMQETRPQLFLIGTGGLLIFIMGVVPQWIIPALVHIAAVFSASP